jgi:hypothetical protein
MSANTVDDELFVTIQLLCEAGICKQIDPDHFQWADMSKADAEAKFTAWKAANSERVRALEAAIDTHDRKGRRKPRQS